MVKVKTLKARPRNKHPTEQPVEHKGRGVLALEGKKPEELNDVDLEAKQNPVPSRSRRSRKK